MPSRSDFLAIALAAGAAAVTFLLSPHWGWLFSLIAIIGFSIYFYMGRSRGPHIEEFEAHNALNLKITNRSVKLGLGGTQLILHSLKRWRGDRRDFGLEETFQPFTPMILYSDQVDLPFRVPRMFQILEFKNPSIPIMRGRARGEQGKTVELPILSHGIWRADLELRWGGGTKLIVQCFQWDENRLPTFCEVPR